MIKKNKISKERVKEIRKNINSYILDMIILGNYIGFLLFSGIIDF